MLYPPDRCRSGRFAARVSGLASGLALAVRPAGLAEVSGAQGRAPKIVSAKRSETIKEVVLATYAHFLPDDDDRAREIMNAFFAPTREGADHDPCALIVPGDRHE